MQAIVLPEKSPTATVLVNVGLNYGSVMAFAMVPLRTMVPTFAVTKVLSLVPLTAATAPTKNALQSLVLAASTAVASRFFLMCAKPMAEFSPAEAVKHSLAEATSRTVATPLQEAALKTTALQAATTRFAALPSAKSMTHAALPHGTLSALNSRISSATPTRATAQLTKSKTATDPANAGLPLGLATHTATVLPRTSVLTFAASTTTVATVLQSSASPTFVATANAHLVKRLHHAQTTVMPQNATLSLQSTVVATLLPTVASSPLNGLVVAWQPRSNSSVLARLPVLSTVA
jgi:hypothetical protein